MPGHCHRHLPGEHTGGHTGWWVPAWWRPFAGRLGGACHSLPTSAYLPGLSPSGGTGPITEPCHILPHPTLPPTCLHKLPHPILIHSHYLGIRYLNLPFPFHYSSIHSFGDDNDDDTIV